MSKPKNRLYQKTNYENVREVIKDGIEKHPNAIAFTLKNKIDKKVEYRDITYKEFEKEINYLGTGFLKEGLKNKRISIIGPNSYQWALSYITILFGIGVVVPLDKGLPAQEIEDSIIRSESEVIIFDKKYVDIVNEIKNKKNTKIQSFICMQDIEDT